MSDDMFDDFDDDFEGDPDEYGDDAFCDDDYQDRELEGDADDDNEPWEVTWDGLQWQDWMIIGPLSEQIGRERRDKERIRRENESDEDDYWKIINRNL